MQIYIQIFEKFETIIESVKELDNSISIPRLKIGPTTVLIQRFRNLTFR